MLLHSLGILCHCLPVIGSCSKARRDRLHATLYFLPPLIRDTEIKIIKAWSFRAVVLGEGNSGPSVSLFGVSYRNTLALTRGSLRETMADVTTILKVS